MKRLPVLGMLSTLAHIGNQDCAEQALETLEVLASWDEEGRVAGEACALLLVLRSRAIDVPAEVAHRIEQERDGARLEAWIRRAVTATSIDDVFADE